MTGGRWVRVTACGNIPPREGRAAVVGDRELAIFNLGDRFLAVDNRCPHQSGPLCDGIVTGSSVVCPLHAWKVNLETGVVERPAAIAAGACAKTYAVRVEGDIVLVELPPVGARQEGEAGRAGGAGGTAGAGKAGKEEGQAA